MKTTKKIPQLLPILISLMTAPMTAGLAACGNSPLLNHVDAPETRSLQPDASGRGDTAAPDATHLAGPCPLAFPKHGLCASWSWDASPAFGKSNSITVRIWSANGGSPQGPYLDVPADRGLTADLWMTSMGHPGRDPGPTVRLSAGVYRVTALRFTMRGDWDIKLQLVDPNEPDKELWVREEAMDHVGQI